MRYELRPETIVRAVDGQLAVGLRCPVPDCGGSVFAERRAAGVAAECAYCEWRQYVARRRGRWVTVPPPRIAVETPKPWAERHRSDARCRCGCGERVEEGGLCIGHRAMWIRAGRPDLDTWTKEQRKESSVSATTCGIDGCDRKSEARGLCGAHYYRWRQSGQTVEAFIAAGGGGLIGARRKRRAEPVEPVEPSEPVASEPPAAKPSAPEPSPQPAPEPAPPAPAPKVATARARAASPVVCDLQTIELPRAVDHLVVGFIGKHLSILDANGAVLVQVNPRTGAVA